MAYRSLELRVGFTIFIAALVLIIGMMWFHGFKVKRSYYELHASFPMVGGIDPGDVVNINGVEKGEVKRVSLRDDDVLITMMIDIDAKIPDDSRIVLQTIGIMGERVVAIILGESDSRLEPGSVMRGVYDPGLSEVLASTGRVMGDLKQLTEDIREIAEALAGGETLRTAIENLASITVELRDMVTRSAPEIEGGVSSFRRSADRVDTMLERNSERLDSMMVVLENVSRELPDLFERVREVTGALAEVARRLEEDDNTMGALMQDRELLDRLESAIANLDELITDIKANPKKYLKIEIF